MDTSDYLSVLSEHQGICFLGAKTQEITYSSLMRAIEWNITALHRMGYRNLNTSQCVLGLDVALGWRVAPVLLAAFFCRVTVVPLDPSHHPELARRIRNEIGLEFIIDQKCVDSEGKIFHPPAVFPKRHDVLKDVALVMYTSGTSGFPKGVMLTYQNIWSNLADILLVSQLLAEDRLLIVRPLTHVSAITGELLPALYRGCSIGMKPAEVSPLNAIRLMEEQTITICCTTPTVAAGFAHFAARYRVSSLKQLILSGERLLQAHKTKIRSAFVSSQITNAYGLTEASPRISCKPAITDSDAAECVGSPLAHIDVRIVDEQGIPIEDGSRGLLEVTGPNVMKGYYGDERLTSAKLRDGWLSTLDQADYRDGQLHVYGRGDDLIIRAGVNVHPVEIESVLMEIEGIREALVFGKLDAASIKIHAWIVCDPGLDKREIYRLLLQRQHDPRLWCDVIELKRALPRTGSGKLIRPKLTREGG